MGLLLLILYGNSIDEWVTMTPNDVPGILGDDQECDLFQRHHSLPRHLWVIQNTPPLGHPTLRSSHESMSVVTIARVEESFESVIDRLTYGPNFKLIMLLHTENVNLTYKDLNTSTEKPENWWNIHLVSYDTITSALEPLSNGQLSHCTWSFWDFR